MARNEISREDFFPSMEFPFDARDFTEEFPFFYLRSHFASVCTIRKEVLWVFSVQTFLLYVEIFISFSLTFLRKIGNSNDFPSFISIHCSPHVEWEYFEIINFFSKYISCYSMTTLCGWKWERIVKSWKLFLHIIFMSTTTTLKCLQTRNLTVGRMENHHRMKWEKQEIAEQQTQWEFIQHSTFRKNYLLYDICVIRRTNIAEISSQTLNPVP